MCFVCVALLNKVWVFFCVCVALLSVTSTDTCGVGVGRGPCSHEINENKIIKNKKFCFEFQVILLEKYIHLCRPLYFSSRKHKTEQTKTNL